jgi:CBS domain-containing protein
LLVKVDRRRRRRTDNREDLMATARDIMHEDVHVVHEADTLVTAAAMMRDQHIGALPVVNPSGDILGIITDRDIVVRCVADGHDPESVTALELVHNDPISVDISDDVSDILLTMERNQIRRVPVIDNDQLVGIISEANVATRLGESQIRDFAQAVYAAPPNN